MVLRPAGTSHSKGRNVCKTSHNSNFVFMKKNLVHFAGDWGNFIEDHQGTAGDHRAGDHRNHKGIAWHHKIQSKYIRIDVLKNGEGNRVRAEGMFHQGTPCHTGGRILEWRWQTAGVHMFACEGSDWLRFQLRQFEDLLYSVRSQWETFYLGLGILQWQPPLEGSVQVCSLVFECQAFLMC